MRRAETAPKPYVISGAKSSKSATLAAEIS
eukprot:SAG11_NODE_37873_length_254_cov_106.258065_1_plen_29_part_01